MLAEPARGSGCDDALGAFDKVVVLAEGLDLTLKAFEHWPINLGAIQQDRARDECQCPLKTFDRYFLFA